MVKSRKIKVCLTCNAEFSELELNVCPNDGTSLILLGPNDEYLDTIIASTYHVVEKLGAGGSSVAYRARHSMLERDVALKIFPSRRTATAADVKQFNHESKAASSLSHPHIITMFDFGILPNGAAYRVLELLEGRDLSSEIAQRGPLDFLRVIKIFCGIADAMDYAHTQGILHGDIKPSNIALVHRDGDRDFVKVMDFGQSLTKQHTSQTIELREMMAGDSIYMSPEMCHGAPESPASDIYMLGIVLFEALVGRPPFHNRNSLLTATDHVSKPMPPFASLNLQTLVPVELEMIVAKMLAKRPEDRFETMAKFKEELLQALSDVAPTVT